MTDRERDIAASLQGRLEEIGFHVLNHLHEKTWPVYRDEAYIAEQHDRREQPDLLSLGTAQRQTAGTSCKG